MGSPRKQIDCFRGEDVLLVADGDGARVYATEGGFDADLSGDRRNVPLTEFPAAVDGAHSSRAQLSADALGTGRIEAAGEYRGSVHHRMMKWRVLPAGLGQWSDSRVKATVLKCLRYLVQFAVRCKHTTIKTLSLGSRPWTRLLSIHLQTAAFQ